MEPSPQSRNDVRRLGSHYVAWLRGTEDETVRSAFVSGLVVLDANVLLALYEVGSSAREEVLDILANLGSRLWVPHQAAIEFSRNRRRVVLDRVSRFKQVRRVAQISVKDAVDVLDAAVAQVISLRAKNRTSREWDLAAVGLDRSSFEQRLSGAMQEALKEIAALEQEHDLHPADLESADSIFAKIDALLADRIGEPIKSAQLRTLVEEAVQFRYPNNIPPGGRDAGKPTDLAAAGDYLLWWETLRRAGADKSITEVLLVTSDSKPDWWEFDKNEKRVGPRPELVQEMRDESGAGLALASLSDFLDGAREYLMAMVSPETLQQVRNVEAEAASVVRASIDAQAAAHIYLLELGASQFEELVRSLLAKMGYASHVSTETQGDGGVYIIVRDVKSLVPDFVAVEAKRYRMPISRDGVMRLAGAMKVAGASRGLLVSTGRFSPGAIELASRASIRLIDGEELVGLLRTYLGVNAEIGRPESLPDADGEND